MNWRGSVRRLKLLNLKYYLRVSLVRQKNITNVLLQDKELPDQNLNQNPQEKKPGKITILQQFSVVILKDENEISGVINFGDFC